MNVREEFPILGDPEIAWVPWRLLLPHDKQAMANHSGQNLEKLASRGGLSTCEAVAVIEDRRWHKMDPVVARAELRSWVESHIACAS